MSGDTKNEANDERRLSRVNRSEPENPFLSTKVTGTAVQVQCNGTTFSGDQAPTNAGTHGARPKQQGGLGALNDPFEPAPAWPGSNRSGE